MHASGIYYTTVTYFSYIAIFFVAIKAYLIVNKLWPHKHQPEVVSSISIMGNIAAIIPVTLLSFKYLIDYQWAGVLDSMMSLFVYFFNIAVASGVWLIHKKKKGLWSRLWASIKGEVSELDNLPMSLLGPSQNPKTLIDILISFAKVDNKIDRKEKNYINEFAKAWNIQIDWEKIEHEAVNLTTYIEAVDNLGKYLATGPDQHQVLEFEDVLYNLVNIDKSYSSEEKLLLDEIKGMINKYLGDAYIREYYVLMPESSGKKLIDMNESIRNMVLIKTISGDPYYVAGPYYTETYAKTISSHYKNLNIFVFYIGSDQISDYLANFKPAPK